MIGLDWDPTFPAHIKPPNAIFYTHNILEGIPFEDETFDFIHIRFMNHCFTETVWEQKLLPELLRVLKPGGWIEVNIIKLKLCNVVYSIRLIQFI